MLRRMIGTPATSVQGWKVTVALILLLTLAALALRFYRLSNQSLWTDEVGSVMASRVPLTEIADQSGTENNYLPGYFLLLRVVVGDANRDIEFRARWLSALAGGLSVPLLIGVVFLWRGRWNAALLAGLLLAINPLHLWYSQEVRAYATMVFFGLLALLAYELGRASRKPWWWVVYALATLGAIALHKMALIFPVVCAAWQAWDVWRRRLRLRDLAIPLVILGVACAALLARSYPPPPESGRSRSILEIAYTFMTFVGGYSFGPSITDIQSYGPLGAVARHPVQVAILGGALALAALASALGFRSLVRGKDLGLLVLDLGFVSLVTLVASFPYNVRYTLPALLGFVAVLAVLTSDAGRRRVSRLAFMAVLLTGLWADAQWFYSPVYRKADSRAVAQWLAAHRAQVKSWTVLPDYLGTSIEWYLQQDPEMLARKVPPTQPHATSFPPVPDALIIGRRHHITDPDRIIAAYRASAGAVRSISTIAGFELYVRQASAPAARAE